MKRNIQSSDESDSVAYYVMMNAEIIKVNENTKVNINNNQIFQINYL